MLNMEESLNPKVDSFSWAVDAQGNLQHRDTGVKLGREGIEVEGEEFAVRRDELEFDPNNVIGRGASGAVIKAFHKPRNEWVALKEIKIEDRGKRHQLLGDLKGMVQAKGCQFLVEFIGAYIERASSVHLVMEFMDRGSIFDLIRHCKKRNISIPSQVLAAIIHQVLVGLQFLHQKAIIHRDIKPQNILANSKGFIKVSDFGIAKSVTSMNNTFVGTSIYMSPERVLGQAYDVSADIWSMGMVFYELITKDPPIQNQNNFTELFDVLINKPEPRLSAAYDQGLRDLVEGCLQRDPSRRASVDDLLKHPFLSGGPNVDIVRQFFEYAYSA
ncbi:unnamed protein product [Vitrella brassicaformis CCMP3155]|uniref:mitogen-activated protein kinase kinase n=1 Tax=Vitrella brassicaformis (strain CCMP3155) TaxID=1169540 RepID=A0A0G4GVM4_VITBC|nr:unnamed protein product [Vitrella brassicaformis CCMP3155]|eukprot:CEM34871.1 unnamed protein product [Vitrella brassicaformis CCMP3155]